MKALKILVGIKGGAMSSRKEIDEAIAELEALQVCDERCEHYHSDNGNYPLLCGECSRFYPDKWEAKE